MARCSYAAFLFCILIEQFGRDQLAGAFTHPKVENCARIRLNDLIGSSRDPRQLCQDAAEILIIPVPKKTFWNLASRSGRHQAPLPLASSTWPKSPLAIPTPPETSGSSRVISL